MTLHDIDMIIRSEMSSDLNQPEAYPTWSDIHKFHYVEFDEKRRGTILDNASGGTERVRILWDDHLSHRSSYDFIVRSDFQRLKKVPNILWPVADSHVMYKYRGWSFHQSNGLFCGICLSKSIELEYSLRSTVTFLYGLICCKHHLRDSYSYDEIHKRFGDTIRTEEGFHEHTEEECDSNAERETLSLAQGSALACSLSRKGGIRLCTRYYHSEVR